MATPLEGIKTIRVSAPVNFARMQSHPQERSSSNGLWEGAKSLFKGFSGLGDIPSAIGHVVQSDAQSAINTPRPSYGIDPSVLEDPIADYEKPQLNFASKIPTSSDLRSLIEKYSGVDLEPHPTTALGRIGTNAGEFAGAILGGSGVAKVAKEGLMGLKSLAGAEGLKQTALGGGIGAGSGVLKETGVNPLAADLLSAFAVPSLGAAAKGTGNLLSNLSPTKIANKSINQRATNTLKERIGEKNLPKVLSRLDEPTPFNANLTTAEMAENAGLSHLHRSLAPNINEITEKNKFNNQLMENQLRKLGNTTLEDPTVGNQVQQLINKNFNKATTKRSANAEPLYKNLYEIREGKATPELNTFLQKKGEFAKGEERKAVDYINKLLIKDAPNETVSLLGGKMKLDQITNPEIRKQLEGSTTSLNYPVELDNVLTELGDKIGAAKKAGKKSLANFYTQAKQKLEVDTEGVPELAKARSQYRKDSKDVNAIDQEPLLKKIIETNLKDKKEFILSPEQVPTKILNGTVNNTKALMKQLKSKPEAIAAVRGIYINKLLEKATLSTGEKTFSYDKMHKFLHDPRNKAKLPIIFEPEQVQVLKNVYELTRKRNAVNTEGRAVGSNTQSETTLLNNLVNFGAPRGIKLLKKGVEWIGGARDKKVQELINQALVDPKIAKALLSPATTKKDAKKLLDSLSPSVLTAIGIRNLGGNEE